MCYVALVAGDLRALVRLIELEKYDQYTKVLSMLGELSIDF